jgi:hypothetical protein
MSVCAVCAAVSTVFGMTKEDARRMAISMLGDEFQEFNKGHWVLSGVEEYDTAWAFFYNTREYVVTLDLRHALAGNGALVIPKSGEEPWFAWSGADTASHVAEGRPAL